MEFSQTMEELDLYSQHTQITECHLERGEEMRGKQKSSRRNSITKSFITQPLISPIIY